MFTQRRTNMKDRGYDKAFEGLKPFGEGKSGIDASCKLAKEGIRLPQAHQTNTNTKAKPFSDKEYQKLFNGFQPTRIKEMKTTYRDVTCNSRIIKGNQGCLNLTPIASLCQSLNSRSKSKRKYKIFGEPTLPFLEAQQQQKLPIDFVHTKKEKNEKLVNLHQIEPKIKRQDMVKGRITPQGPISHTYNTSNLCQKSKSKLKFNQTQLPSIPQLNMKFQTNTKLHQTLQQKEGLLSTHLSTPRDILGKIQSISSQQPTFIDLFHKFQPEDKEKVRKQQINDDSISNIEQFDSESIYTDDQQLEIIEKQLQQQRKNDPHQLFSPTNFQNFKIPKKQSSQIHYKNILDCSDLNSKYPPPNPPNLFTYIPILLISLSCLLFFIQSQ